MQRDYFLIDHNNSSERDAPTFRGSGLGEDEVRGRRIPAHEAAERAIRERYLDERSRIASLPPPPPAPPSQSDFAPPLPPPPHPGHHPHHYGVRWSALSREPPSSLMSPESPEDCRASRHPPSPLLLKKSESKSDHALVAMQQHYQHTAEGQGPHHLTSRTSHTELSPAGYPNYIPPHYRAGPMYSHQRLHEYHPHPYPLSSHHHHLQQHGHQITSSSRLPPAPPHSSPSGTSRIHQTTPPRPGSHPDHEDDPRSRTSPIVSSNFIFSGQSSSSPSSSVTSGSLKHRILVRPPDLDLSSLERERYLHLQRVTHLQQQQQQQQQQTWKVPESPRMSSKEYTSTTPSSENKNGTESSGNITRMLPSSTITSPSPQYPAHFAVGSLIQLSNGDLKRVEDLTTEDFVRSAEFSHEVGIDHSAVTHLKQSLDNGSVTIGFSVGKEKIQVAVEAALEHPFFIVGQGWSSASPQHTMLRYRLPCHQLKVGDVCISLTHRSPPAPQHERRSPATTSSSEHRGSSSSPATSAVGEMRPPPVPPADRERHRSRSSSPATTIPSATSNRTSSSSTTTTRLSPQKQVVFSDRVVLHSPPLESTKTSSNVENGSKVKLENRNEEITTFRSTPETSTKRSTTETTIKEERRDDEMDDKSTTEEEELEVLKAKKLKRFSHTSLHDDALTSTTASASSREGQNRVLKPEVESRQKKIGDT